MHTYKRNQKERARTTRSSSGIELNTVVRQRLPLRANNNTNQICQPKGLIPLFRYFVTRPLIAYLSLRIRCISVLSIWRGFTNRNLANASISSGYRKEKKRGNLLLFRSISLEFPRCFLPSVFRTISR